MMTARKRWEQENAEHLREYRKRYYEVNKARLIVQQSAYVKRRLSGPEGPALREYKYALTSKWRKSERGKENNRQYMKMRTRQLRAEMLAAYGERCACCGETAQRFLTLDHIGGGGLAHRKSVGNAAWAVLNDVKKQGWPKDKFRVLCMNCNFATRGGFPCPHEVDKADPLWAAAVCDINKE